MLVLIDFLHAKLVLISVYNFGYYLLRCLHNILYWIMQIISYVFSYNLDLKLIEDITID